MIAHRSIAALLAFCAVSADGSNLQPFRIDSGQLYRQAADKVSPSVVMIETVGGTQPTGLTSRPSNRADFLLADGPTTGLIYSADGLIITSMFNFLRNPSVITVVLADGRRLVGQLLATDEVRKLAMLKVDADRLPVPQWRLADAPLLVGQSAIALGRGFGGAACSMNVGIISGLNRMSGLAVQTDAHLSPANFGGPLIDLDGRVIGICVPMGMGNEPIAGVEWYDSGIGFAVPLNQVRQSAENLAVGHTLRHGLLGVQLDGRSTGPVRVIKVADPSPAMRAGLRAGDIIVAIAGHDLAGYADLKRKMRSRRAGEWLDIRVRRGDEVLDLKIMPAVPEDIGPLPATPATQPGFAEPMPP